MSQQRIVYLAYPIDQAGPEGWTGAVLRQIKIELGRRGLGWYDPGAAFAVGNLKPGREVAAVNHQALACCTGVVAFMPPGVPTIGVPMEIERALRCWSKPVSVVSDIHGSWSLLGDAAVAEGRMAVWGATEAGIEQAVGWLQDQPNGVVAGGDAPTPLPFKVEQPETIAEGWTAGTVGQLPTRAYPDDAGLDLYCSRDYRVEPSSFVDLDCGVSVELPEWSWGLLTGRSSTLRKRGLLVHQGVIDAGYRGPLYAGVWNLTQEPVEVKAGERLAQLIVLSNATRTLRPVAVEQLAGHARGDNGFGSSGA